MNSSLVWLMLLTMSFCCGIVIAEHWTVPQLYLLVMAGLSLCGAAYLKWRRNAAGLLLLMILFLMCGAIRFNSSVVIAADDVSHLIGQQAEFNGTLSEPARIRAIGDGKYYVRYTVKLDSRKEKGGNVKCSGKAYAGVIEKSLEQQGRVGDKIKVFGMVREIHGYQNPGQLDIKAMEQREGITASIKTNNSAVKIIPVEKWFMGRFIDKLRHNIMQSMQAVMSDGDAAALFAMLFGGYEGIRPEMLKGFTLTGIIHILSVSGSHITLLAGTMETVGRLLGISAVKRICLTGAVIFAYALVAGFVPPVIRSAVMGMLSFTALAIGRQNDARYALGLVGLAMLIIWPGLLFDISFQLSFAATAGLLYLVPLILPHLKLLPRWAAGNLAVTIAAQLAAVPFMAWYFNSLSISSLVANVFVVPLIELMILVGLAAILAGTVIPLLGKLGLAVCGLAMGVVWFMVYWIAKLPGSNFYLPTMGIFGGLWYYLLLTIAAFGWRLKRILAGMLAVTVCFVGVMAFRVQPVQVHFIDVGQGDAMLLITPHGHGVMIDTGGTRDNVFDIGERVVVPYLHHYGIRKLDAILLTHAHEDHAGGARAIMEAMSVKYLLGAQEELSVYARTFRTDTEHIAGRLIQAYTGQRVVVDGVEIVVERADKEHNNSKGSTGNELSNVYRISYQGKSFLITGDLDAAGEAAMLAGKPPEPVTVLKVAHHGSKTSSTEEFLQAVRPEYAVISVGKNNNFGHPNKQTLERLNEINSNVLRTDEQGAVIFTIDNGKMSIRTFADDK